MASHTWNALFMLYWSESEWDENESPLSKNQDVYKWSVWAETAPYRSLTELITSDIMNVIIIQYMFKICHHSFLGPDMLLLACLINTNFSSPK